MLVVPAAWADPPIQNLPPTFPGNPPGSDLFCFRITDMERVAVAGISMGSWRTLNFAAMHSEVDAAVVSGLYIPWEWLFSEAHCRCQHPCPSLGKKAPGC